MRSTAELKRYALEEAYVACFKQLFHVLWTERKPGREERAWDQFEEGMDNLHSCLEICEEQLFDGNTN